MSKSAAHTSKTVAEPPSEDPAHAQLMELWEYRMPFGKYKGLRLVYLPEPYVVWFAKKGFPKGKLGDLLRIVYEIKVNGLEYLFDPFKEKE